MKYNLSIIYFLLHITLCCGQSKGQQIENLDIDAKSVPLEANLAIVAVGARPEVRYQGNRVTTSSQDEKPPAAIYVDDINGNRIRYVVGLNGSPHYQRVPAGKLITLYKKIVPHKNDLEKYATIPAVEPGTRSIVFLRPASPLPNSWKGTPNLELVNLDSANLKGKDLLITNFTPTTLKYKLGTTVKKISPGSQLSMSIGEEHTQYKSFLVAEMRKHTSLLVRTTLKITPNQFNLFVLYQANPKTNRGKKIGFYKTTTSKPAKIEVDKEGNELPATQEPSQIDETIKRNKS